MVGWRCPLLREILGQNDPPSFKNGDFHSIFARSDYIVTKRDNFQFITQCKGDIIHAFKTAKIIVFNPMMCKSPHVPLQDELLT